MSKKSKSQDRAVAKILATYGLQSVVARACGITPQAVHQWKKVPPHLVYTVTDLIDMTPEQIRPDVFRPTERQLRA